MCEKLPIAGFEWIDPSTYTSDKIENYDDDDSREGA